MSRDLTMYHMLFKMVDYLLFCSLIVNIAENAHANLKERQTFHVIWNIPSEVCQIKYGVKIPLYDFDIRFNNNQSFWGEVINLFYEPKPGLYPRYKADGTSENGGLPQVTLIASIA